MRSRNSKMGELQGRTGKGSRGSVFKDSQNLTQGVARLLREGSRGGGRCAGGGAVTSW